MRGAKGIRTPLTFCTPCTPVSSGRVSLALATARLTSGGVRGDLALTGRVVTWLVTAFLVIPAKGVQAVSFENQVTLAGAVPDAQISARFSWWFETKTEINAYAHEGHSRAQLRKQSMVLEDRDALLFVMTPDPVRPAWSTRHSPTGSCGSASATWARQSTS
jgi:hypothetical protein